MAGYLQHYPTSAIELPPNPYAPVDMPEIAWQKYGETRGYADIAALHATGGINTTLPNQVVLALRRACKLQRHPKPSLFTLLPL